VCQLPGKGGRHLRLNQRLCAGRRLPRPLQHRDQIAARHGKPGANPVLPKRHRTHPLRIAACGGAFPGGVEQRVCRSGVAGAQPGVRLGGEQVDQVGIG
jgi:hypothetical protein